jgi:hypothetical protein
VQLRHAALEHAAWPPAPLRPRNATTLCQVTSVERRATARPRKREQAEPGMQQSAAGGNRGLDGMRGGGCSAPAASAASSSCPAMMKRLNRDQCSHSLSASST